MMWGNEMIAIKYIGKKKHGRNDNITGSGLYWKHGETLMVSEVVATKLLAHKDIWSEGDPSEASNTGFESNENSSESSNTRFSMKDLELMMERLLETGGETVSYSECVVSEPESSDDQPGTIDNDGPMEIAEAFSQMRKDVPGNFSNTTGKPEIQAVQDILAREITQDDLDAAWDQYLESGDPTADDHLDETL